MAWPRRQPMRTVSAMPSDSSRRSAAPGVRLRVLGSVSVEVVRAGDVPRELGPRLRRLLAILATQAGSVVSVDTVADAMWGDDQPAAPGPALHTLVSRLRVALRATTTKGESAPTVLTRAPGYLLDIDRLALDASRFEELAGAGRTDLGTDPAAAAVAFSEALGLWRGPAYAEFADEEFARTEASRLDGLHDTAVEDYAEALLTLGRHDDAVPLLQRLISREPLRERALGQLILARYRRGQQAEALDAYQHYRERLADEHGLDPSPRLQQLQQDILRQDAGLEGSPVPRQRREHTGEPSVSGTPDTEMPTAGNLPAVPPVLIGREADLAALAEDVRPGALVTLTGPGGVGKTSLALRLGFETSDRFRDGVWFCDLSSLTSGDDLALAVMSSLDLQAASGADPLSHLLSYLRVKRQLLVLDNCEQVLSAAAALTHEVHRLCRHVGILATSRSALDVSDERVWPVQPLSVPSPGGASDDLTTVAAAPAVQLFVDRTRRRVESFELDDRNLAAVAEICRRLDGLPLAIELAAARMGAITPADLVDRLSWRFQLLHGGSGAGSERHRTLQALVDWSFDLLDEDHKRVFEVLSVFAGDFDLDDAERLLRGVPELEPSDGTLDADIVLGLVDRSMISVSPKEHRSSYSMLEILRGYGRQQLQARPWVRDAHLAHARMVADLTTDAAGRLYGPEHVEASSAISGYLDELRAAHGWALTNDLELAARLVGSLMLYVEHRMPVEVQQWAERTLRAAEASEPPTGLAGVYAVAAAGARFTGDLQHATDLAERGLQLAGDPTSTAYLHVVLGEVALFEGRLDDAEQRRAEVTALAGTSNLGAVLLLSELVEPLVAAYRGDEEGASRVAEGIEERAAKLGAGPIEAWARYLRAEALLDSDPELAADLLDGAMELAQAQGDRYANGVAMVSAASVRGRHGDPHLAVPLFRDVIDHWSSVGDWTHQWTSLRGVVDVLLRLGRHEDAAVLRGGLVDRALAAPIYGPDAERMAAAETLLLDRLGDELFTELSQRGARMADDALVSFARTALAPTDLPAQRSR